MNRAPRSAAACGCQGLEGALSREGPLDRRLPGLDSTAEEVLRGHSISARSPGKGSAVGGSHPFIKVGGAMKLWNARWGHLKSFELGHDNMAIMVFSKEGETVKNMGDR